MFTLERSVRMAMMWLMVLHAGAGWPEDAVKVPRLGKPIAVEEAAKWDLNVFPDGTGLPVGRGTAVEGRMVYDKKCTSCHGEGGRGGAGGDLAGGLHPLTGDTPDKTIGLFWPYATTIFDFTRRAMPMDAPGSLTGDEIYAVTAYLLHANGIVGERDEMNAKTLPRVRMPNVDGFIAIDTKPSN